MCFSQACGRISKLKSTHSISTNRKFKYLPYFIHFTHSNDTAVVNKITHLFSFFPCLTLSCHTLIIFRIYAIENRLDFVSLDRMKVCKDDVNLLANVTFPSLRTADVFPVIPRKYVCCSRLHFPIQNS